MPMTPQDLIRNLGDLPPLPRVATRVIRLSADAETSAEDLQRLVQTDQALSSQLLKVANSAMFGMVREVTTLTQAIMTLGFSTTRSVVLAASVKHLFTRGPVGQQERSLWEHALVAAILGSAYAKAVRYPATEEVFLASLMHDIGKCVMLMKFPESYGQLPTEGRLAQEEARFGFDHTQVGEALVHSWNLAERIEAAVRWHHEPLQAPAAHRTLVALVALGNEDAHRETEPEQAPPPPATLEAMGILHLDGATLETHRLEAQAALARDRALINEF